MEFKISKDLSFQDESSLKLENELLKDEYKKLVIEYQNLLLSNKILMTEKSTLASQLKITNDKVKNLSEHLEHYKISFIENKARTSVEIEYKSATIDELKSKVYAKQETDLQTKFYQYKILELIESIQSNSKTNSTSSLSKANNTSIDEIRKWVQDLVK